MTLTITISSVFDFDEYKSELSQDGIRASVNEDRKKVYFYIEHLLINFFNPFQ